MKRWIRVALTGAVSLLLLPFALSSAKAEAPRDLERENLGLRQTMRRLEERIARLEQRVEQLQRQAEAPHGPLMPELPELKLIPPAQTRPTPGKPGTVPPSWGEREFNGLKYYIVPCRPDQPQR